MKKNLILTVAVLPLSLVSAGTVADWQKHTYESEGFTLPYQLFTPTSVEKLPLIIHLHGSGEAGTDNISQMYEGTNIGPQYFASKDNQMIQAAYVLAPQTPESMRWASTTLDSYVYEDTPSTASMTALLGLIDQMITENESIDTNRIHITGLSRGGQGVWNALFQRPELFAASVPIAGSADTSEAQSIAAIPTWVFHGNNDDVTNVNYSREMVDSMIRAGGSVANIRYSEIEDGDHASSWLTAFDNSSLYQWLMKQHN